MSSAKWITLKLSSLKQYKFIWRFLQVWNSGVGTCRWFCLCSWGCRQQVSQSHSYLKARLELGGPTFPVIQSRSLWAALPPHMGLSVIFDCPSPWWLASPTVSNSGAQTQATEPQMSHFVNRTVFCSFEMSQKSRVNNWAISCLFIFFFWLHRVAYGDLSSPTRDRTRVPPRWKRGVLTTGLPENSQTLPFEKKHLRICSHI